MKFKEYAMKRTGFILLVFLFVAGLLAGCNYPTQDEEAARETAIAETVAASIAEEDSGDQPEPTPTDAQISGGETDSEATAQPTATSGGQLPTATLTPTSDSSQIGDDEAAFVADVTIPDYTEIETGEDITKTWRIRNSGTTTWKTSYMLEFEKGEKLGAPTQIPLPKEVKPGELVDISVEFTVPNATGEYSSYWILKNDNNERVGVAEEGKHLTLFMVIVAVKDGDGGDGGSGSSGGISGGAKVTDATVSVTPKNFTGSCPADLSIKYTVTTSNAGKVQFNLVFNVVSPSGYKFDPPPQYLVDFSSGYTVYYDYSLFSSDPVTATVRVRAVGSNEFLSDPVQFSVKCN